MRLYAKVVFAKGSNYSHSGLVKVYIVSLTMSLGANVDSLTQSVSDF